MTWGVPLRRAEPPAPAAPRVADEAPRSTRDDFDKAATRRQRDAERDLAVALPSGRDATALRRTCASCGHEFTVLAGEVRFHEATGMALPGRCRRCRPTRRAALAARGFHRVDLGRDEISDTAPVPPARRVRFQNLAKGRD